MAPSCQRYVFGDALAAPSVTPCPAIAPTIPASTAAPAPVAGAPSHLVAPVEAADSMIVIAGAAAGSLLFCVVNFFKFLFFVISVYKNGF